MSEFPYEAKLVRDPGSAYASEHMTVGQTYTVFRWAGSCVEVSTDVPNDTTLIWHGWLERVVH